MSILEGEGFGSSPEVVAPALETIKQFSESNEDLRKLAILVHRNPTARFVESMPRICGLVGSSARPFFENDFYIATGNHMLVEAAVGAVMTETEAHWHLATDVSPEDSTNQKFVEAFRGNMITVLTSDECVTEDAEEDRKMSIINAVGGLCNIHQASVYNLLQKITSSEKVINFNLEELARKERKKQLTNAGLTTAATFIGTALAYGWMQHRNK